ncbi:16S rRNA (cytosine(1402)-N(4))-methyltransferase [bacterium]|nr:16S rRNA (cytosine(1402)-N(4))-methyltransferase [bacterium]
MDQKTCHTSVLPRETLDFLSPQPGATVVDGTLGGGGHTRLLAEAVGPEGLVIAIDRDATAIDRACRELAGLPIRFAQANFCDIPEVLEAGMTAEDIDWLVPHQANVRIIEAMQKKMNMAPDRVVRTVERHANTSAASIPLALAAAVDDGRIKNGDLVAMEAIGGGLVWGAALVKFGRPA